MRIVVADHEGGVVTEIDVASIKLDGIEIKAAEVLLARLGEPPAVAGGGYDPFVRLHEIGNTYCDRGQRFVVSFVNGEPESDDPDPDQGEAPIETPAAALRRTLQFLGSSDGYQNHWYIYDRRTDTLHMLKQEEGGVRLAAEDAPTTVELADDAALVEHLADEHPSLLAAAPRPLSSAAVVAARTRHDGVHVDRVFAHDHDQPEEWTVD
jgi:hypothetical protein